jgi:hypothetical protein
VWQAGAEDEGRSCGGGVKEESAARWHVEIVGWYRSCRTRRKTIVEERWQIL